MNPVPMANVTITPVPLPRFFPILNQSFGGFNQFNVSTNASTNITVPNWTFAFMNTIGVYTDYFGNVALLILALIPFAMMYISQGNMKMSVIVGIISCVVVFPFISFTYQILVGALVALEVSILIYGLVKP